ncbi:hypothetical protein NW754_014358 [Fusarium falciforme]|uniref:NmrA-like domain-containing protein n=1 Tax=Fusarium falciforme TaxID=195108 RepID=A0A9W8QXZ1_9HYPO|nr:hypothetical protein NW754_014358 [Fusarium falciforme]KAJ4180916.1 hypothetical protein NW755_011451 [Fusarium falciforme]KAJ4249603.1 hypothetical protein NW757_007628 [Fusarium falciforme]
MPPTIKNVAIAGAASTTGGPILDALIASNLFQVTILTRKGSRRIFPAGVAVKHVDYSSVPELTEALRGQDALINTTNIVESIPQINLVDAAAAAGVYRYLPSEFGLNNNKPEIGELPVFKAASEGLKHLREKCAASGGVMTYTDIHNGGLLDWGFETGFTGILLGERVMTLYDDGSNEIAYTTREWLGKAVVRVLTDPKETANRPIYIANTYASQNKLLALAQEVVGDGAWTVKHRNTDEMFAQSMAKLEAGDIEMESLLDFIHVADNNPKYETRWEKDDNELLSIPRFSDEDIKAVIRRLVV